MHILKAPLKIYSGITLCGYGKQSVLYLSPEMRTATIINAEDNISNFTLRDVLIEGAINVKENSDPNHDRRLCGMNDERFQICHICQEGEDVEPVDERFCRRLAALHFKSENRAAAA